MYCQLVRCPHSLFYLFPQVRIPLATLQKAQIGDMLYYSWLQLDSQSAVAKGLSGSSAQNDELRFEQSLYAGPRTAEQPKI